MAQTVSNDALWEKLSEIDKKIDGVSVMQKSLPIVSGQSGNSPDFTVVKDEIIAEIKAQVSLLGAHGDINYKAINQNISAVDENVRKIWNIVSRIRKQQRESAESQQSATESQKLEPIEPINPTAITIEPPKPDRATYLDFRIFKVRKTTLVITLLALLVFTLTLFCMKQQNDYAILNNEYNRLNLDVRGMGTEVESK